MNVIVVIFDPEFHEEIFKSIKYQGVKRTEASLIDQGFHPSFVKVAIKRIMGTRGW